MRKIVSIIIGTVLTLVGVIKLFPSESFMGVLLSNLTIYIGNDPFLSALTSLIVLFLGGMILVTMIFDLAGEKKRHSFMVGSRRFCSFFARWYSRSGPLSIICDDLEGWVNPNDNDRIMNALKRKSQAKELHLFLGKESPAEIINELRSLGAWVGRAPTDIITNYSFSCLSIMGNHSAVIVRNKQLDKPTKIIFEEVSNSYISGLLNTIIKEDNLK